MREIFCSNWSLNVHFLPLWTAMLNFSRYFKIMYFVICYRTKKSILFSHTVLAYRLRPFLTSLNNVLVNYVCLSEILHSNFLPEQWSLHITRRNSVSRLQCNNSDNAGTVTASVRQLWLIYQIVKEYQLHSIFLILKTCEPIVKLTHWKISQYLEKVKLKILTLERRLMLTKIWFYKCWENKRIVKQKIEKKILFQYLRFRPVIFILLNKSGLGVGSRPCISRKTFSRYPT